MLSSYAKINLGLRIVQKRPDGFHDIETIFHRIDLSDTLAFLPDEGVRVDCDHPDVPGGERNICYAAADRLRQHLGLWPGVYIRIRKSIPVGAGLGGGSSDAATVLRELPRFWDATIDEGALRSMALQLGSDVPFFLGRGSALARGRGEILEYFDLDIPYSILLCSPGIHISTAWAYQQVRTLPGSTGTDLREIVSKGLNDPESLRLSLRNDFEPPVFQAYPELSSIKDQMLRGGALYASLSGSGSSVFGLFVDTRFVEELSILFRGKGYRTFLTPPHFQLPAVRQ